MIELIVMRLADMIRVHPDQITGRCSKCGEEVGIYPSGQRVMQELPDVELVCQVCRPPEPDAMLAPGAELEPFASRKRDKS
ncbi:hypothetical protein I6F35_02570 [Bradyrhizobium sp. BRP22]|uniref:hypothetical protein n=1 Tax=Bradyrhizobium sp. BRP22 TaxID=2793821 RepID=UPI001CD3CCC6|nr:hypothetical protein [Bradyrhizobium sp. BRP22]MCA1452097.1 hypothetical protein [Bradyrhizobium sp. BRP22]